MSSTVIAKNLQVGADLTATNNFTIFQPSTPDGTLRIGNGNTGITASLVTLTSSGNLTTTGSFTSAGASNSGNLTFTGTGNRITGDMSSATLANRVAFQTSTVNGSTTINAIPNGTGTASQFVAHMGSDPANTSRAGININSGSYAALIFSDITGTGTYLPMTFLTGGSERMRLDTSGNLGIGTTSPAAKLVSSGSSSTNFKGLILRNGDGTTGSSVSIDFEASAGTQGDEASMAGRIAGVRIGSGTSGALTFSTTNGGVLGERMRIDSSGNLGLGQTPTAYGATVRNLEAYIAGASGYTLVSASTASVKTEIASSESSLLGQVGTRSNHPLVLKTNDSERMRIDASGNVGIGTSSPSSYGRFAAIGISGTTQAFIGVGSDGWAFNTFSSGTAYLTYSAATVNTAAFGSASNIPLAFLTNNTERARIDSSGNFLVGSTTSGAVGTHIIPGNTGYVQTFVNTAASTNHFLLYNVNATNNSYRFYVNVNGGIYNYSGNNVNISDERTKKNIELAGGYLDKICAIPVKLFNYKDEAEGEQRTLGVIAQDVEAVAPEFVNNEGWKGTHPEDGVPLKTIYTTDMLFGLMKAIQELKAEFDAYKSTHP